MTFHTRKLNANQRELTLNLIASNYNLEYTKARKEADEDLDFYRDFSGVIDDACTIDPELLPKAKKARVAEAFGDSKFRINTDNLYMMLDTKYLGNKPVPGVSVVETDHYPPRKTFVAKEDMTSSGSSDSGSEDEMVTIKIKTGKGGLATFRVPKSEAGDMVG